MNPFMTWILLQLFCGRSNFFGSEGINLLILGPGLTCVSLYEVFGSLKEVKGLGFYFS